MKKPSLSANLAVAASQPEANLGECLRAIRQRNRWTLADVSEKTGLATSTLSRVENNQMSLTYENVMRICKGLGMDISELFAATGASAPDAVTGRRTYTPPGHGRSWQANHYVYTYLCTELANKKMTPILGKILARSLEEAGGFLRHEGEEIVYVLDGSLDFHTEFYEPLRVEKGGCIYFDSRMGHAFVSAGDYPVTMLSVCSSPEHALVQAASGRAGAAPARRVHQPRAAASPRTAAASPRKQRARRS